MVYLNPPKTPNQDSDEQRALSLQTVFPFVHSYPPLKLSTLRSAVLPCEVINEDKIFEYCPREQMAMVHETAVECEQIMPPANINPSNFATASDFSKLSLDPETKTTTGSDLCDSTIYETTSTLDMCSNSSTAMPTSAKIDQVVDGETSLQSAREHHTAPIIYSTISSVVPAHHQRQAQQSRNSRNPATNENMKARSRRAYKTLPEVVEKKRQEEQLSERREMLEKAILLEQAHQEKRRRKIQLMTYKIQTLLEEK
ncbi:hypothetical protein AC1031_001556 [Aphanomyces cochlioides]|nr:hypothetical protein AC1031_001556 [Aphanomyces cochlioides]